MSVLSQPQLHGEPDAFIIRCDSVGWLLREDDDEMKAVAPNMGGLNDERSVQVSGVIQIPTRCVLRVTELAEPALTCP